MTTLLVTGERRLPSPPTIEEGIKMITTEITKTRVVMIIDILVVIETNMGICKTVIDTELILRMRK